MNKLQEYLVYNKISLSRFINYCLYKKEFGFYQKNPIGRHFITAPEVSQLFGECLAIFFSLLIKISKTRKFCELGPGNGTLMKDIITSMRRLLNDSLYFSLYDKSNFLKSLQMKNLISLNAKNTEIVFLKKFKLEQQPYFFICNEFFDALPINQYEKRKNMWFEKKVVFKNKFQIINERTNLIFDSKYKNGDIIESSPLANLYLTKIFKHIKKFGGGILIFDYGPFKKKNIDTLQAIHLSKKCEILDYPFDSDITYHVDFEDIKNISNEFGLFNYGPITQRKFLFFHGINERVMYLLSKTSSKKTRDKLEKQFERLTSPEGMGSLIKCLFISNYKFNLKAFEK